MEDLCHNRCGGNSVVNPDSFNPDPDTDPDPEFRVNPDQIRIQGFDDQNKIKKYS
jgi:hypothetical protein